MTVGFLLVAEAGAKTPGLWTFVGLLGGIVGLMLALRFLGLCLAATHPGQKEEPTPAAMLQAGRPEARPTAHGGGDPKTLAIIAATVSTVLQKPHAIVSLKKTPSVESLMQQWSMEGRRAIYSSHKFR